MLVYEDNVDFSYKICGIDPGINFLGASIIDINHLTLDINNVFATTFRSSINKEDDTIRINQSERVEKLLCQKSQLVNFLKINKPNIICSESPFYNHLTPSAFGPLTEMLFVIKDSVMEYSSDVMFLTYSPSIIKISIGTTSNAGKDEVKLTLLNNTELNLINNLNLLTLDNNSLDAIATAYTHVIKLRKHCL